MTKDRIIDRTADLLLIMAIASVVIVLFGQGLYMVVGVIAITTLAIVTMMLVRRQ